MPYLTNDEYVERYGETETIRITDTAKTGAIDEDKVATAIKDASQFSDGYIAVRYKLPIPGTVPDNLKWIVAALARENLHKQRPTQAVTEEADRARSQLKDISRGAAVLLIDGDTTDLPETNPYSDPRRSHDARGRVFSDAQLDDYTSFDGSRGYRYGPLDR